MVLLEIVTPDGKFYKENVAMVIVRGVEGDLALMHGTAPIVTPLAIGALKIKREDGTWEVGTVNGGYVSGLPEKVTVVTEAFEWAKEIDLSRAEAAKERAERRLQEAERTEDIDVERARIALSRALNRMRIGNEH